MRLFSYFQPILQLDHDLWPWYITDCMNICRFTYYIKKLSLVQIDFNFSNKVIVTFSPYLITWPQMTFDLHIWPLTLSTNEGSHVASITQLWLKSIKKMGFSIEKTWFSIKKKNTGFSTKNWVFWLKNPVFQIWLINLVFPLAKTPVFWSKNWVFWSRNWVFRFIRH